MSADIDAVLESLRPSKRAAIMDIVAEAGIDVSCWAVKQDGSIPDDPKKNPRYCYEWAFGGDDEPMLLCVWHRSLTTSSGYIEFQDSLRQHALGLDRVAIERANPPHVKSRARDQARRARRFDSLVQRAYRKTRSVRVVLLMGEQRSETELGWDTSKVKYRLLDTEPWYVHSYSDDDGHFRMVRAVPVVPEPKAEAERPREPYFVDQFSVTDPPMKRDASGSVYPRSKDVREDVLRRAGGVCECCGTPGFETDNGSVFLETHHVIPLSEGGPDRAWNVVALCPNDHKRAHFANDRRQIQHELIQMLLKLYPGAREVFEELAGDGSVATN